MLEALFDDVLLDSLLVGAESWLDSSLDSVLLFMLDSRLLFLLSFMFVYLLGVESLLVKLLIDSRLLFEF